MRSSIQHPKGRKTSHLRTTMRKKKSSPNGRPLSALKVPCVPPPRCTCCAFPWLHASLPCQGVSTECGHDRPRFLSHAQERRARLSEEGAADHTWQRPWHWSGPQAQQKEQQPRRQEAVPTRAPSSGAASSSSGSGCGFWIRGSGQGGAGAGAGTAATAASSRETAAHPV